MKFGDIVALAKQGYTPADIKELLSLSDDHSNDDQDHDEDPEQKGPEDDQDHDEGESDTDDHEDQEDIDYKKEFEAEREKNAKLQKIITSKDVSGSDDKKSDLDIFSDVMKDFM